MATIRVHGERSFTRIRNIGVFSRMYLSIADKATVGVREKWVIGIGILAIFVSSSKIPKGEAGTQVKLGRRLSEDSKEADEKWMHLWKIGMRWLRRRRR